MTCNVTDIRWWPANVSVLHWPCATWQASGGCPEAATSACDWSWSGQWPCFAGNSTVAWLQIGSHWRAARRAGAPCGSGTTDTLLVSLLALFIVATVLLLARVLWARWRRNDAFAEDVQHVSERFSYRE